ncbi:AMP-binding protein [Allokutzneria oryzae]|uniref:AMP-binding protein n=1 Tax=Allokutzneria oryzae TaxID=1378989 RepID=A0ABV5ZU52_9PSEU
MALTLRRVRADIAEFLLMEPEELTDDLDLYDAGLDSVRMLTIVDRWREFGVRVSFAELAERPTVADWWSMLSASCGPGGAEQATAFPLTSAQRGILAAHQLDPSGPAYNTAEYVEIFGVVDAVVFERALRRVVDEVEALRCRIEGDQQVLVSPQWMPHIADLRGHGDPRAAALKWMRQDLAVPVDLAAGPLFGHGLLRVEDEVFLWYHRVHHIALDGFGVALVARRVAEVYTALVEDRSPPPHNFGSLAEIEEPDTSTDTGSRDYWLDYLADCPPVVSFADGAGLPSRDFLRVRARVSSRADLAVAAVGAYLSQVSGFEEVVLGLPVLNRAGSAMLRVPCTVLNAIPLRLRVEPDDDLVTLSRKVADDVRRGMPHQHYRYEQLRRDLGLVGGHKRLFGPVVNVMPFDYDLSFGGASCEVRNLSAGPVEDLAVNVYDRRDGNGIEVVLDGNPDRYSVADLERHLGGVLGFLGAEPSVLDGGPLRSVRPVAELIAEQVRVRPQATAVESGSFRLTYAELVAAAENVAERITDRAVLVDATRDIDTIVEIVGVIFAGAAYVPVDRDGPPISLPGMDFEDPAYVIHTSGSTGQPNAVVIGQRALNSFVAAATERYGINEADRVLQFAPLHFDASVEEIFPVLCAGGTLVLRTDEMTQSVQALLRACDENEITVLDLPTAYWHELAFVMPPLPASLRTVIIGGEAALPERVERWHAAQPHVRLINTYGPTEATVVATAADLVAGGGVPIGRPLPGVKAVVADADGRPVPVGVAGELWLSGSGLALGYLGRPDLTARRFRSVGGERAYRTGDRARLGQDGELYHLGRVDDEFKISGHRVSPAAIEAALVRHPNVRAAMVTGHTRPDGTKLLTARVVADTVAGTTVAELREHLRGLLPAAVVPGVIELVEALPLNRSGKIDRSVQADDGTVLGIMRHILGQPSLSTEDDFFEAGGQSLQTIQVANRIGAALGTEVPAALVFRYPTAGGLARALRGTRLDRSGLPAVALADAVLDRDILPAPTASGTGRILLTGATGFVGGYLLAELVRGTDAEIICLTRSDLPEQDRVRVVRGDVGKPWLGLDVGTWQDLARVDAIYHCAAVVSLLREYDSMRAVNVEGTRSLLRLAAAGAPSRFHYVSTVSVALGQNTLATGYQQSKWVAEQLVLEAGGRGLDTTIHRLGRVVGPKVNPQDVLWRLLLAGIPAGVVPKLHHAEPWADAEDVAREILAQRGGIREVLPERRLVLDDLREWIIDYGYPVEMCSREEWRVRVTDADPTTLALLDLWPDEARESTATSTIDRATVHRYLDQCADAGLLPVIRAARGNSTGPATD